MRRVLLLLGLVVLPALPACSSKDPGKGISIPDDALGPAPADGAAPSAGDSAVDSPGGAEAKDARVDLVSADSASGGLTCNGPMDRCAAGMVCATVACHGDNGRSCRPLPTCPGPPGPKCGCDLVTYPSLCALLTAGTAVVSDGPCWAAPVNLDAGPTDELLLLPLTWGGRGAQMDVTATGVTFKVPCGTGEFVGPPLLKNARRGLTGWTADFSWEGKYLKTGAMAAVTARFSGTVSLSPSEGIGLSVSAVPGSAHLLKPRAMATPGTCTTP